MFSIACNVIKLVLLLVFIGVINLSAANKLQVQVYYETKCPDSIKFFKSQLIPSMVGLGRLEYTDLQLIPFGKAIVYKELSSKQLKANCQHGESECADNALHGCILETNEVEKSLNVIGCLMQSYSRILDRCSEEHQLILDPVNECLANRTTGEILEKYGKQTQEIELSFVPSIAINGVFDYSQQNRLLNRFDRIFCQEYQAKYGTRLDRC